MRIARVLGGLLGLGPWVGLAFATDVAAERTRFTTELFFERLDTDGDGTIGRKEFRAFADFAPRLRGKPELTEQAFDRLDADHDGAVTLEEYLPAAARQVAGAAMEQ